MDALLYLFSLGFSGSDALRALVLVLLGSLFVTTRFPPMRMTILLLIVDQIWPYAAMLNDGYSHKSVELSIRASAVHWQDAMVGFLVRAAGFYLFIRGTFSLRRKLHNVLPDEEKQKALPF